MASTGRLDSNQQSSSPKLALDGNPGLDWSKQLSPPIDPGDSTLNRYAPPHLTQDYEIGIQGEKNRRKAS